MIIKRILNLKINLTIEELLVFASVVKKQLIKAITENKMVQFPVNILGLSKILEAKKPFLWYFMRFSKAKVKLKISSKITTLLDTNAKINVMIKKVMDNAELAMR